MNLNLRFGGDNLVLRNVVAFCDQLFQKKIWNQF